MVMYFVALYFVISLEQSKDREIKKYSVLMKAICGGGVLSSLVSPLTRGKDKTCNVT